MKSFIGLPIITGVLFVLSGCANTVKLEAPDKPIAVTVDVNIKQVDQALDKKIASDKKVF
ncbi:MAG: YnbE family lipoprotein [Gammaproteobacteria bacterium]|nr:YnbE family lipoprotein [Gammaproteobacteria bacterium]